MVRYPRGPLRWWPRGHVILALSSGPSVELVMYRRRTSAGSPHRAAPALSRYAGQLRNIAWLSIASPSSLLGPVSDPTVGQRCQLAHAC